MRKFKILSVFLAVVLLLSVIPVFNASAENNIIYSGADLSSFAESGGTVELQGTFQIFQPITVKKDLTINIDDGMPYNGSFWDFSTSPEPNAVPFDTAFTIEPGVTLTINTTDAMDGFSFGGTLFELQANETKAAKLVIGGQNSGAVIFKSTATGNKKPQIIINNGRFASGTFLQGNADVVIHAGEFSFDPKQYVAEGSYSFNSWETNYTVVKLNTTYSDEFKKNLDANGDFEIKRYHPSVNNDLDALFMDLDAMYYEEGYDFYNYYSFMNYNINDDTALVCYSKNNYATGESTNEYHLQKINFVYDPEVKKDADKMIAALPKGNNPDEGEFHWFKASDLELVNYWLSGGTDATQFINFSGEFKKAFNYKNYTFKLDSRMGGGAPFDTSVGGIGLFMQNGIVYGSGNMGVEAKHILYVPSSTANTTAAKKAAAQNKLDDFIGKGKVTVKESNIWESIL